MAEAATLGEFYYPLAAGFQVVLAGLILASGRPSLLRGAFAMVLVLNAFEALLQGTGSGPAWAAALPGLVPLADRFIVLTLPFLASQFPVPLGGPRGARVAAGLWVLFLASMFLNYFPRVWNQDLGPGYWAWNAFVSNGAVPLALAVLATHTLPRTLRLDPGPLRTQAMLVAAGLGVGLGYSGGSLALQVLQEGPPLGVFVLHGAFSITGGYFLAAALCIAGWGFVRGRRWDAAGVAAALAGGLVLSGVDRFAGNLTSEFVTQTFRPALFAVAMLRYDLFRTPPALRRPALAATAAMFLVSVFVLLATALAGQRLGAATALDPVASMAALVLLGAAIHAFREPLAEVFRASEGGDLRDRLTRYRLALEAGRSTGDPRGEGPAMQALRRDLGLSRRDHEALEAILDGHLLVPMAGVVGARPGQVVGGRYEVLREVGRGGQGRALLARDAAGGGQEVVLKEVLRSWETGGEARKAALHREATLLAGVRSPHVARTFGVVEEPWQTYLVREHVPGETLEAAVTRAGPLPPRAAAGLAADLLAGLGALHAAGVLHLDVKPANVVLRPDGRAVLIDTGAARSLGEARDATRSRPGSEELLSLRWAAPEQLVLGGALGPATDQYQAAGVLYFAATGRLPAEGASLAELERSVLRPAPLPWPAGAPTGWAAAVRRARHPDPAARWPDAAAFGAALLRATRPRPRRGSPGSRRR